MNYTFQVVDEEQQHFYLDTQYENVCIRIKWKNVDLDEKKSFSKLIFDSLF